MSFSRGGLASFVGRDADCTLVWLRGEHDVSTVAALSEILALAIALDDADLVVDLSQVEFMAAATVGVVVWNREFLRLWSRTLELRCPSTCARRVLDVCGLDLIDCTADIAPRATRTAGGGDGRAAVRSDARVDRRVDVSASNASVSGETLHAAPKRFRAARRGGP